MDLREKIGQMTENIEKMKRERDLTISEHQENCPHDPVNLREAPSDNLRYSSDRPPFRVCISCGRAEDGWGSGYYKLKAPNEEVAQLSRSAALKFVIGGVKTQDDLWQERRKAQKKGLIP